jgi:hypothetical protein
MLFGKGTWSIFGIEEGSQEKFEKVIETKETMFALSQAFAEATLRFDEQSTGNMVGINPFGSPRKDEAGDGLGIREKNFQSLDPVTYNTLFGLGAAEFKLNPDMPWYGFWAVFNTNEDVDDAKSKQESVSYEKVSRPFKFLNKDEKKLVVETVAPVNVGTREQFPVLIDFASSRIYMATTNKDNIEALGYLLEDLGITTFPMEWDFNGPDWMSNFLNKVYEKTKEKYYAAMFSRAEDVRRLGAKMVEKMDDKDMERIVSNFFAIAELDSGQWAALYPNAAILLSDNLLTPVTVADVPSTHFLLRGIRQEGTDAHPTIKQAGVAFQELDSKFIKKTGVEKVTHTDIFTFDFTGDWANLDLGVAFLRGFDIPGFKKAILKSIRKTKQELPISFYWSEWLRQMNMGIHTLEDNVRLTLELKEGGLVRFGDGDKAEVPIEAKP